MQDRKDAPVAFKRKGSPFYQYDFVVQGQRFRGSTGLTSSREADRKVEGIWAQARDQITRGEVATEPTIEDVFRRHWTSEARELDWAPAVFTIMKGIVEHVSSRTLWRDVSNAHVASYIEWRYEQGVSVMKGSGESKRLTRVRDLQPATINRALSVWQRAHRRARDEWEWHTRPISWTMHREEEPDERVRAISLDEARLLLHELPTHLQWVVAFSLVTGVRRNEVFTLTWRNVDLANRECHVIAKGKHGGTRPVALNTEAMAIIGAQAKAGRDALVFDLTNWRKRYAQALDAAGITDFRWHDLRHTFATWAGRSGVPLEVASKALGHSSIDVTMRYRHVFKDEVADALASLPMLGVTNVDAIPAQSPHTKVPTRDQQTQETRALKAK